MNNKKTEWPISPTFLSLRRGCSEESANYNSDGIYYTDYLRGFLADLSHDKNVQNALSLFQFVPEDFLPHDPNAGDDNHLLSNSKNATVLWNYPIDERISNILDNRKIIRIDSGTFINNGKLCDSYRGNKDYQNTFFCFRQDSIVGLFADSRLNQINPATKEYRDLLDVLLIDFNKDQEERLFIKKEEVEINNKTRVYIHYTCPISLFEEHIFPIYAQEHIIACLMFGQTARGAYNNKGAFLLHRDKMCGVKDSDFDITIIEDKEWGRKVNTILDRIDIFEQRIKERIEHCNIRYINDEFRKIELHFREKIRNINIGGQIISSVFSHALNTAFTEIREKFDSSEDGFVRMFALKIDAENNYLVPIGWSDEKLDSKEQMYFFAKKLEGKIIGDDNQQVDIILEASSQKIRDTFDRSKDVFFLGRLTDDVVAYVVWKRHSIGLKAEENNTSFKTYKEALKKFYSVALECYSFIRGYIIQHLLESMIKETTHESAHFILPAIYLVEKKLKMDFKEMLQPQYELKYLSQFDEFRKCRNNILELLEQLSETNRDSSIILSPDLKMKKTPTYIYDLLNKSRRILSNRAIESYKEIKYIQKKKKIKADVDVKLCNNAIFNLLDNAMKYGYDGSNIYIYMDHDIKKNILVIRVISYGIGIKSSSHIYNLFERGEEVANMVNGTGIGLHIVQKVCKAHGGSLSHTSEKLSDYNIPVLFNYKYRDILANKCTLKEIERFGKEISRLTSEGIEHEVVNNIRFVQYAYVFSSRIDMPTYRNTFYITIPLH